MEDYEVRTWYQEISSKGDHVVPLGSARRRKLKLEVTAIDEKIESLQLQYLEIQRQIRKQERERAKLQALLAPVSLLSIDLFREIMAYVPNTYGENTKHFYGYLEVCQEWGRILVSTSQFWCRYNLGAHYGGFKHVRLRPSDLSFWIANSGGRRLFLSMDIDYQSREDELFRLACEQSLRWKALDLGISNPGSTDPILNDVLCMASNLTHLSLSYSEQRVDGSGGGEITADSVYFPHLTRLEMFYAPYVQSLLSIKAPSLVHFCATGWNFQTLFDIRESSQYLEEIFLHGCPYTHNGTAIRNTARLQTPLKPFDNLRLVTIADSSLPGHLMKALESSPHIERMSVDIRQLVDMVPGSSPTAREGCLKMMGSVKELNLICASDPMDPSALALCWKALYNLKDLQILSQFQVPGRNLQETQVFESKDKTTLQITTAVINSLLYHSGRLPLRCLEHFKFEIPMTLWQENLSGLRQELRTYLRHFSEQRQDQGCTVTLKHKGQFEPIVLSRAHFQAISEYIDEAERAQKEWDHRYAQY